MKKQNTLEDSLFKIGLFILALCFIAVPLYFGIILEKIEMPLCVFDTYLQIYCPGCGGTRSMDALFHGQILESVWYHPIVLYMVIVFGGFMLTQSLERLGVKRIKGWKFHNWYLYGGDLIMVCNFLIKNLLRKIFGIII